MSTVELEAGRDEAEQLVLAALDRTEGVRGYTAKDAEFVVRFRGLPLTSGQQMTITLQEHAPDRTTLAVTATRTSSLAFTANPWKQKSRFLAHLRALRADPDRTASAEPGSDAVGVNEGSSRGNAGGEQTPEPADSAGEPVDTADLETLRAVRILLAVVLALVGVVLLAALVASP